MLGDFLDQCNTCVFNFVYGEHLIDRSDVFSIILYLDCFDFREFRALFNQMVFWLEEVAKEINRSLDSKSWNRELGIDALVNRNEIEQIVERMLINPDQEFKENAKKAFQLREIIDFYSKCPLCGGPIYRTPEIFYSDREDFKKMREHLIRLREQSQSSQVPAKIGILCCKCYKKIFGIEEEDLDIERYMEL